MSVVVKAVSGQPQTMYIVAGIYSLNNPYSTGKPPLQCTLHILSKPRLGGPSLGPALDRSTRPLSISIAFDYFLFCSLFSSTA